MGTKDYSGGLRFAIMLNSLSIQKWQYETIKFLLEASNSKVVLLIINEQKSNNQKKNLFSRIISYPYKNILFKVYYRYLFRPHSFAKYDLNNLIKDVPSIRCLTNKKRISEYFTSSDIDLIKSYEPDFILKFGFGIIKGEILNSAPLGVWSFHHDDEQKYRGVPPAFWEIYNNEIKSAAILQRLTDKLDSGVILRKGLFKTINHSWKGNLDQSITLSRFWPAEVCREIIEQNTFPDSTEGVKTNAPLYKIPGNTTFLIFLLKVFVNKIKFHIDEIFKAESWQIGITKARTADLIGGLQYQIEDEEVDWYVAKNSNFYFADAFAIKVSERLLILYEDYTYETRKGRLSAVWFSERENIFSDPVVILEENWHLSYPFIFKHNDNIYCIPEAKDHKNVELYKLDLNTMKLVHVRTLIKDLEAVDPSLIFHQNAWYLFFTAGYASNVELHIWHSETLEGEFIPHVLNPIKSNVGNSRPAGSLFYIDGILYRPAQDCSRSYGSRVILNEVKILSEDSFLEITANVLEPPKGFTGLHNLSFAGDYMIFDCKRMKFSSSNFFYQIKRKLGFKSE